VGRCSQIVTSGGSCSPSGSVYIGIVWHASRINRKVTLFRRSHDWWHRGRRIGVGWGVITSGVGGGVGGGTGGGVGGGVGGGGGVGSVGGGVGWNWRRRRWLSRGWRRTCHAMVLVVGGGVSYNTLKNLGKHRQSEMNKL
jgi:hypothetical protein